MNIYIGNLSFETTEDQLRQAFEAFGEVSSVKIISDNYSGKSKGFGFVEMPTKDEAVKAIGELNGKEMNGRNLNVNEARAKSSGGSRGGGNRFRKSY